MPYNRSSMPKQLCPRCQGLGDMNPSLNCICSQRSSLVVSEHNSHVPRHGAGLTAPMHLEHRGSYVQVNGTKFIKKKKTVMRKKSEDDEERERTIEFGEEKELRNGPGNEAKIVKRVKVF